MTNFLSLPGLPRKKNNFSVHWKATSIKYQPSELIIKQGETGYSFFVLLKGVVCIVKSYPMELTIAKLKAGAVFGEIAYVAKRKRTTSVIADGDVIALKIDTKNIDALKPAIPTKLKDNLIEILVKRLETMNKQVTRNV